MSKRIFELIRFITYSPPVHEFDPQTNTYYCFYPNEYIGLQSDEYFWYYNGIKITHCLIKEEVNPIKKIFESTPENAHPELLLKQKEYERRKRPKQTSSETGFNYNAYINQINQVLPDQEFLCRFITLSNWRKPANHETFAPYAEELFGVQVKNKLHYIDFLGTVTYVFINKPENKILKIFDEIPPDAPETLIEIYLKAGNQLKLSQHRHEESLRYHNKK